MLQATPLGDELPHHLRRSQAHACH